MKYIDSLGPDVHTAAQAFALVDSWLADDEDVTLSQAARRGLYRLMKHNAFASHRYMTFDKKALMKVARTLENRIKDDTTKALLNE